MSSMRVEWSRVEQLGESQKWFLRFLRLAEHVSSWSRDPSTKTGAVIAKGNQIISLGYNGFPRGMRDDAELYANREAKYSRVVHCEVNAVLFGDRDAIKGATLYTWPFASCDRCAVQMIQAGITRYVFPELLPEHAERWGESMDRTKAFFDEAGLPWIEVPRSALVEGA